MPVVTLEVKVSSLKVKMKESARPLKSLPVEGGWLSGEGACCSSTKDQSSVPSVHIGTSLYSQSWASRDIALGFGGQTG